MIIKNWLRIASRNYVSCFSVSLFLTLLTVSLVRYNKRVKAGHCELLGVTYPCAPIFDPVFYRSRYGYPTSVSDEDLLQVAANEGIKHGHLLHPGEKIFKIVVMTMDEWPLIRSWVLYHAHIFGGENVYVLDGSSNPDQISFLKKAALRLGVVVFFTSSSLHHLENEINIIMRSIAYSTDFLTKSDSDEFIVRLEHNADYGLRDFSVAGIRDEINRLPVDGRRYKFTYYSHSVPITNCTFGDDPAITIYFEKPWEATLKTFFVGPAFASADLGNHFGRVREPTFSNTDFRASDLAIAHYHYGCFDVRMFNTKKALLSLGYISENDPVNVQIGKLSQLDAGSINSGHKVMIYLDYLRDPVNYRLNNEHRSSANTDPLHKDVMIFHGISTLVSQLTCEWEGKCEDFKNSK
jgi:hypothetical protein